ncbi:hypothetical protein AKJ57_05010 [candidate division MSBL1 archaeon SCGC-AAA259A05]|uniref:Histidine kinase n=1 Tax=candidate division MSBL1 archaeon SCGC-AAA259A05 TaxID=1698259 RepID=A0A133U652_9EURY|nr:hypothetical protein AKJ57_05010 [candidate division MSBL1 archaeon SCGC-AAA259A05]
MKVLFVNAEPDFLKQAKTSLPEEDERLSVETTTSAEDALELLDEGDFDGVVSGYKMPDMGGLELLRILREKDNDIPFIVFTGEGCEEVAREALNLGADRYLSKGGDPSSQYDVLADAIVQEVEQRRAEEELIRKGIFLESMLEYFPASLYVKDREGRILIASDKMKEDLREAGYNEILGKTDFDLFSDELAKKAREREERVMKTGEPITTVEQDTAYDGTEIYLSTTKVPIKDKDGNVIGTIGITRDISERKKTGEAFRKAEREKKWILDSTSEFIIHQDLEHRVKWINKAARDYFGEDFDSRVGKGSKCYELLFGLESPCEGCPIEEALKAGKTRSKEMVFSDEKTWLIRGNPARNEDGDVVRVVEVVEDITERKDDMKEKVFERSFSGETSRGTGMGAYLVKMVAQTSGGDVTVKDSELGGARFDVHLQKA